MRPDFAAAALDWVLPAGARRVLDLGAGTGKLTAALVDRGLDVVAITDHDGTSGWTEALDARPPGLTVVPGVEISCAHVDGTGRRVGLHLLAYLLDPDDVAMQGQWALLHDSRRTRARRMVSNLAAAGYPISWTQVAAIAGNAPVGRPHLGRALVESGVVPDVNAAFGDLLSSRRPYYVPKADTDVFTAIALVLASGGVPVFAHPIARGRGPVVADEVIADMAAAGLVGIEVDHPDHDADDRAHAAGLAHELGLVGTGSSDYHGANKTVRLGAELTSPDAFAELVDRPTASRPVAD